MKEELDLTGGTVQQHTLPPKDAAATPETPVTTNKQEAVPEVFHKPTPIRIDASTEQDFVDKLMELEPESLIPWEDVELPSKGLFYDWDNSRIRIRAMGQAAEKVLVNQRLSKSGQSIEYLFAECCRFPDGFDPAYLILGDKNFLLYYLRGITHGNLYEFAVTCPNMQCGAVNTHIYDLNELVATIKYATPGMHEPFNVDLPHFSDMTGRQVSVGVRFLRAIDVTEMLARRKLKNKTFASPGTKPGQSGAVVFDDMLVENFEKIIVSVNGVQLDRFAIRKFVEKLHAKDAATIRQWLRQNSPGIDSTVSLTCPDCMTSYVIELPITESFFRPTQARGT